VRVENKIRGIEWHTDSLRFTPQTYCSGGAEDFASSALSDREPFGMIMKAFEVHEIKRVSYIQSEN
jgi:hypothetical protein